MRRSGELVFAADAKLATAGDYVIKDVIPQNADVGMFGPSGAAKTSVAIEIGSCLSQGKAYRGHRVKRGSCLLVPYEGQAGIEKRIIAANAEYGDAGEALAWLKCPGPLGSDPSNRAHEHAIIRSAKNLEAQSGLPCRLVVVDTLARALGGDNENEAQAIAAFLARVQRIRAATGASVLLIHHPGKNEALGMRGSSALFAALDVVIRIEREKDQPERRVYVEKAKDGIEGQIEGFTLKPVTLGLDDEGDPITSCVISPSKVRTKVPQRPSPTTGAGKALTELEQLIIAGKGRLSLHHERISDGAVLVSKSDWRTACRAKSLSDSGEEEAEKKAFARAVRDLENRDLVAAFGDRVWLIKGTPVNEVEGDV